MTPEEKKLVLSGIDWTEDDFDKVMKDELILSCFLFMLWYVKKHGLHTRDEVEQCLLKKYIWTHMCLIEIIYHIDDTNQWDAFFELEKRYSTEQLEAWIIELKDDIGVGQTPDCVAILAEKILDVKRSSSIAVMEESLCDFGLFMSHANPKNSVTNYVEGYVSRCVGTILSAIRENENLAINDMVDECEDMDSLSHYDRVVVDNFIGVSVDEMDDSYADGLIAGFRGFPSDRSVSWNHCGIAIQMLKDKGRAIATMTAGQLSNKLTLPVRQFLVENGYIEGVIALPEKLYNGTWISTYLLVLGKGNKEVKFYDARSFYEKGRNNWKKVNIVSNENIEKISEEYLSGTGDCMLAGFDDLRQNDYVLLPHRYSSIHSSENTITLGEYASEIRRGITLSAKEIDDLVLDEPTGYKCITPACLSNGIISTYKYFDLENYDGAKVNYAYPGDLLINKVGNPLRVAVANDKYVVVGNIYILSRNNQSLNPFFVKCFLDSPKGQQEILKYAAGNGTAMISVANVKKIEIPVYEESRQKHYEEECAEITRQLQATMIRLQEFENQF